MGCNILKVSGYLRGQTLSANLLVHIPGWGDFRMKQIDAPDDPFSIVPAKISGDTTDRDIKVLEVADSSKQVSIFGGVVFLRSRSSDRLESNSHKYTFNRQIIDIIEVHCLLDIYLFICEINLVFHKVLTRYIIGED